MHRARALTINTSNACLVTKSGSGGSGGGGGTRPLLTPPPRSCRLHKIYEEKLEILGAIGHENWFDEHANPFYRLDLFMEPVGGGSGPGVEPVKGLATTCDATRSSNASMSSTFSSSSSPTSSLSLSLPAVRSRLSVEFTGFEELSSESEGDDESEEGSRTGSQRSSRSSRSSSTSSKPSKGALLLRPDDLGPWKTSPPLSFNHFGNGYNCSFNNGHTIPTPTVVESHTQDATENAGDKKKNQSKIISTLKMKRISNRNRIMDRGHLLPDLTVILTPQPE